MRVALIEQRVKLSGLVPLIDRFVKLLKNPWHKTSEELPKEGDVCLVIFKPKEGGRMLLMLSFQDGYFNDFRAIEGCYEYWMPIPELPKED